MQIKRKILQTAKIRIRKEFIRKYRYCEGTNRRKRDVDIGTGLQNVFLEMLK